MIESEPITQSPTDDRREAMLAEFDKAIDGLERAVRLSDECGFRDLAAAMRLAAAELAQEVMALMAAEDGAFRKVLAVRFERLLAIAGDDPAGLRPLFRSRRGAA